MQFRSGRCNNDLFCSLASGGHAISVPADGNFVCPQCSKPLVAAAESQRRSPLVIGALAGGSLALAGGGLFAAGTFMGSGTAAQMPAARAELTEAVPHPAAPIQVAMAEVQSAPKPAAPAAVSDPPPAAAPPTDAVPAPAQAPVTAAPAPAQVQAQAASNVAPAPTVAVIVNVGERRFTPWPPALASGTRFVRLETVVAPRQFMLAPPPGATLVHPAVLSAEAQAAAKALAEQVRREQLEAKEEAAKDAEAAAQKRIAEARATANLAAAQRAAERAHLAQVAATRQQQTVAAAQPAAKAPAPAAEAAAPTMHLAAAGASRRFAAVAISGGAPDYPDSYYDTSRVGRVTVSCRIEIDGSPHNCHVVDTKGGAAFGKSVLKWLSSGQVRYQPALRNGAPVAETQQWNVNFTP